MARISVIDDEISLDEPTLVEGSRASGSSARSRPTT